MIYSSEVTFTDELISEISGNSSTSAGSIDILQAAGKTVTQAARKIAESIADLDTIGKQTLAAARVVLVLIGILLEERKQGLPMFKLQLKMD